MPMAVYLPDSGSLPPWVRIVVGVVVIGLVITRLVLSLRSRRRRR
ncbi:hypothetical protein ACIQU5_17225 [Streptomyces sp. NPDC090306]